VGQSVLESLARRGKIEGFAFERDEWMRKRKVQGAVFLGRSGYIIEAYCVRLYNMNNVRLCIVSHYIVTCK